MSTPVGFNDNAWDLTGTFSSVQVEPGKMHGVPEWLEAGRNLIELRWWISDSVDSWRIHRKLQIYI